VKIVVGMRCLNEEDQLPVALANYPFADAIVIADGGSTDRSKEIALADPRVVWRDFPVRVPGKNQGWRNPEGSHMQFLINQCEALSPDWVWLTEVDVFPALNLQREARSVLTRLNEEQCHLLTTWLLYIAPDGFSHYPATMLGPGSTAWHPGMATVNSNADFEGQGEMDIHAGTPRSLSKDFGRIHLTWETEELIQRKQAFYRDVHGWDIKHPDINYAREPLPEWAVWNDPRNASGLGGYGQGRDWER
jgi:hypothetical protein